MKKNLLEIYALAVCFITVVCFVIAAGIGSYSLIEVAKPDFTMSAYLYEQYQTNDSYWNGRGCLGPYCGNEEKKKERPGEAELTRQRQDAYSHALLSEQRAGSQTLVKAVIVMLIDAVVFLLHWLIALRARRNSAA